MDGPRKRACFRERSLARKPGRLVVPVSGIGVPRRDVLQQDALGREHSSHCSADVSSAFFDSIPDPLVQWVIGPGSRRKFRTLALEPPCIAT